MRAVNSSLQQCIADIAHSDFHCLISLKLRDGKAIPNMNSMTNAVVVSYIVDSMYLRILVFSSSQWICQRFRRCLRIGIYSNTHLSYSPKKMIYSSKHPLCDTTKEKLVRITPDTFEGLGLSQRSAFCPPKALLAGTVHNVSQNIIPSIS